jgi:hypothetical protein
MSEVMGPFPDVTLEEILTSYENGQKKQASVMINWYGTEFWYDYASWLVETAVGEVDYHNFVLMVISYNVHFPHPNHLK